MNTQVESAFLASVATLPAISIIEKRTGVSEEENAPEDSRIIVHCQDCEHVSGPLWRATVAFRIETPAFDNARAAHETRLDAIRVWLDNKQAVGSALQIQGMTLRGYHVQKSTTSLEENRWIAEIGIVAGVDTSG
jgi:hypothetical protein